MGKRYYNKQIKALVDSGIEISELCKKVPCSTNHFYRIRKGQSEIGPVLAANLHRASNGLFDVAETCPEFFNETLAELGYTREKGND